MVRQEIIRYAIYKRSLDIYNQQMAKKWREHKCYFSKMGGYEMCKICGLIKS